MTELRSTEPEPSEAVPTSNSSGEPVDAANVEDPDDVVGASDQTDDTPG